MTIRPGDFWVADILFTDRSAAKRRPILVLWLDGQDVVSSAVTSAAPRVPTDVLLADWVAVDYASPRLCAYPGWIVWNSPCCCLSWGTFRLLTRNV